MPGEDWIKLDLHIHTLDDPKDVIDYSAHQLLKRAKELGFGVLAITLHDAVFDRAEVFADAAAMGILLIPAAEVRLQGADAILLNVTASEVAGLKNFEDLRQLRARRGISATADPSGRGSILPAPFIGSFLRIRSNSADRNTVTERRRHIRADPALNPNRKRDRR